MTIIRTLSAAGFALMATVAGAAASTDHSKMRLPMVYVQPESQKSPSCDFSGFRTGSEDLDLEQSCRSGAGGHQVQANRFFPNYSPIGD